MNGNPDKPRCGYDIDGPKIGRLVAWRKRCQRIVKNEGDRCWQHGDRWSQKPGKTK